MSEVIDTARPVREGEEVDARALEQFFSKHVPELAGKPVSVLQFPGGHSNLTYLLKVGERELVMRRPPFGTKVKSAHDMGREHRILSALSTTYSYAPKPLVYSEDPSVMGAPFYVMERLRGVILRKDLPPELGLDATRFRSMCEHLVDALVELHALDYRAIGLDGLGKPEGYVQRQVQGWSERYVGSQTDDVPVVDQVAKWLEQNRPADSGSCLIHNDFKFDNVLLDADDPMKIRGILDWEMSTIGDPLMDLGTFLGYWVQTGDDPMMQFLKGGPTDSPGGLTRAEIIDRYQARSGRSVPKPEFYYAFGLFKTAVVIQQIYYRYRKGLTKDERFSLFGHAVKALCEQAARTLELQG
ncbi:MAG TPA: phosphotransferase family protein [Polyangiales bacterium]|nr:phosphotransferase family protein [Polyangiales bacterium]